MQQIDLMYVCVSVVLTRGDIDELLTLTLYRKGLGPRLPHPLRKGRLVKHGAFLGPNTFINASWLVGNGILLLRLSV